MAKRDKRSRLRGRRSCGYGARKKHRSKGSKGGKGMAGSGKKSGTKRTYLLKYFPNYLGAKGKGFTSINDKKKRKLETINLDDINKRLEEFKQKGLFKNNELNLEGYKVLGAGNLNHKIIVKASKFSGNAKEKIESSGGKSVSDEVESEEN
jgi:large subunit ribosomal protein L15